MNSDRPPNTRYSVLRRLLSFGERWLAWHFKRRHPDVFTLKEAAVYLGLEAETVRTLHRSKMLESSKSLGRELRFHRQHLDECVRMSFAIKDKGERR